MNKTSLEMNKSTSITGDHDYRNIIEDDIQSIQYNFQTIYIHQIPEILFHPIETIRYLD